MIDFITAVYTVIIAIVFLLVRIVLTPIDDAISEFIPSLSTAITNFGDFIELIISGLGWAIQATGIPTWAIGFLASMIIADITLRLTWYLPKLALAFWRTFKR